MAEKVTTTPETEKAKTVLIDGKFTRQDTEAVAKKAAKASLEKTSLSGANSVAELRQIIMDLAAAVGVKIGE